jgi:hypothetical protein
MQAQTEESKREGMTEEDLCELILENAHFLTCFNCGGTLESQTSGIANDTRVGILHIDPREVNYPREPDMPASAYFECLECYEFVASAATPTIREQKERRGV